MTDNHPVKRDLHLTDPHMKGEDIARLQAGINQVADDLKGAGLDKVHVDGVYGAHTARAASEAAFALGANQDEVSIHHTPQHIQTIIRHPGERSEKAKHRAQDRLKELIDRHQHHEGLRSKILDYCEWGCAHEPSIHYAQSRPMPLAAAKARSLPQSTDCSGFATCAYYVAGAPDPNGLGYNGQGYTGTMLSHMHHISQSAAKKGDLVVFGNAPGTHVVVLAEDPAESFDPLCYSHGQEAGPFKVRLSVERGAHAGQSVNFLQII